MEARIKQLKEKMERNITKLEATNADLQRKIDIQNTKLEGKIDAGNAALKQNLSQAIPDYNTLVKRKYTIRNYGSMNVFQ